MVLPRSELTATTHQKKHVELLVLTMMIATVRLAAGPDWRPPMVLLQTKDASRVQQHVFLRARQSGSATDSPRLRCRSTFFQETPHRGRVQDAETRTDWTTSFLSAIRQVVEGMMLDGVRKFHL